MQLLFLYFFSRRDEEQSLILALHTHSACQLRCPCTFTFSISLIFITSAALYYSSAIPGQRKYTGRFWSCARSLFSLRWPRVQQHLSNTHSLLGQQQPLVDLEGEDSDKPCHPLTVAFQRPPGCLRPSGEETQPFWKVQEPFCGCILLIPAESLPEHPSLFHSLLFSKSPPSPVINHGPASLFACLQDSSRLLGALSKGTYNKTQQVTLCRSLWVAALAVVAFNR